MDKIKRTIDSFLDEHVGIEDFLNGARHIGRILDGFARL